MVSRARVFWSRAISSFGRALPWHGRGDRFDSGMVHMFKEFFVKKMLQSKGVPKEQIEPMMAIIKKNPAFFQQIAGEIEEKVKKNKVDHMTATMEIINNHRDELQKLLTDK